MSSEQLLADQLRRLAVGQSEPTASVMIRAAEALEQLDAVCDAILGQGVVK